MSEMAKGACGVALGALLLLQGPAAAQDLRGGGAAAPRLEARVWLDRGDEPVLRRGEDVRLYYRASADAFVGIFQVDTNGGVRLVFPRSPDENHSVRAGRDYRLLFPRSPYWRVEDDPGLGYFFVVASTEPFDLSPFGYSHFDRGWDISRVGRQVDGDPHVAMDDFVAALVPGWESVAWALDFVAYHVGGPWEYPRFLCYDCHGFRPFSVWNPYHYACSSFRVVVYDDPYYYPLTRYRGSRVVYAQPPRPFEPRFAFKERAAGEPAAPLVVERERSGGEEAERRPVGPGRDAVTPGSGGPVPRAEQRARPVLQRRAPGGGGDFGPPPSRPSPPGGPPAPGPPAREPAGDPPRGGGSSRPARGSGESGPVPAGSEGRPAPGPVSGPRAVPTPPPPRPRESPG